MSACDQLAAQASAGVAPALRAVDCLAAETTASAFARLFGPAGGLVPALTILLTLYIALFALALLTGRSRLGVAALTPRMLSLGLVLTFATSWIAYQQVVWTLATAAPDQIASLLTGGQGPATRLFADRIDLVFSAIADVAQDGGAGGAAGGTTTAAATGMGSPAGVLWLGALLLLLGTVGVLVTARIALAVLLAVGPVFVVLALFSGTRGLTAGWLRGVVMTALVPLFVVVGGGIALELLVPIVTSLRGLDGEISGRAAMALFLVAAVHAALMVLIGKVTATTVSAWTVFGLDRGSNADSRAPSLVPAAITSAMTAPAPIAPLAHRAAIFTSPVLADSLAASPQPALLSRHTVIAPTASPLPAPFGAATRRARGIGSRFQSATRPPRMMFR